MDDPVCLRLVGPGGRQHRHLSLALTALLIETAHSPQTAMRYVAAFRNLLNVVEAKREGAADAFVSSVADCRRTIDRYLTAMSVRSKDLEGGARWLRPPANAHRRVADTIVAIGKITRLLTGTIYGGQDPSKVDAAFSRTKGERLTAVNRFGAVRMDVDRRLRIGADPTVAPRLDDPHVFNRWTSGLVKIGAGAPFVRILAMLRHSGMRCFQALGLTLHDVFCLGRNRRLLPVPNKGDLERRRTLFKRLPPAEYDALLSYVDGHRAHVTGVTLRDIRRIAQDPLRWRELEGVPLFTENGVDHLTYDRLRKVTRQAAVKMRLILDDDFDAGEVNQRQRVRYVGLHMLRHEYVHERLAEIEELHPTRQAGAKRDLIRYMGWSGESMLRWYSEHLRLARSVRASIDHNAALDAALAGRTSALASAEFDDALEEALEEFAWDA